MDKLDLVQEYIECRLVEYGLVDDGKDDYTTTCLVSALRIYKELFIEDPQSACVRVRRLQMIFESYIGKRWINETGSKGAHSVWQTISTVLDGHARNLHNTAAVAYTMGDVKATLFNVYGDGSCFFQAIAHSLLRRQGNQDINELARNIPGVIRTYKMSALNGMREIYLSRHKSAYRYSRWERLNNVIKNDLCLLPTEARSLYIKDTASGWFQSFLDCLSRDRDYMGNEREVFVCEIMGIAANEKLKIFHYIVTCNKRFTSVWQEYNRYTNVTDDFLYQNPKNCQEKYKWVLDTFGNPQLDERGEKVHETVRIPSFKGPGDKFEVELVEVFRGGGYVGTRCTPVYLLSVGRGVPLRDVGVLKYNVGTCHWGFLKFSKGVKPINVEHKPFTIRRSMKDALALREARMPTATI